MKRRLCILAAVMVVLCCACQNQAVAPSTTVSTTATTTTSVVTTTTASTAGATATEKVSTTTVVKPTTTKTTATKTTIPETTAGKTTTTATAAVVTEIAQPLTRASRIEQLILSKIPAIYRGSYEDMVAAAAHTKGVFVWKVDGYVVDYCNYGEYVYLLTGQDTRPAQLFVFDICSGKQVYYEEFAGEDFVTTLQMVGDQLWLVQPNRHGFSVRDQWCVEQRFVKLGNYPQYVLPCGDYLFYSEGGSLGVSYYSGGKIYRYDTKTGQTERVHVYKPDANSNETHKYYQKPRMLVDETTNTLYIYQTDHTAYATAFDVDTLQLKKSSGRDDGSLDRGARMYLVDGSVYYGSYRLNPVDLWQKLFRYTFTYREITGTEKSSPCHILYADEDFVFTEQAIFRRSGALLTKPQKRIRHAFVTESGNVFISYDEVAFKASYTIGVSFVA